MLKNLPEKRVAYVIGSALAMVQDTADLLFNWGFKKLKTAKIKTSKADNPRQQLAKTIINRTLGFFGELGNSFYNAYDERKAIRNKRAGTKNKH